MATITDTTTDANGNIIINVSSSANDAITLATAGTYSDKNIIFNITTPAVDFPEQVQSDWEQNDDSSKDYIKNRPFYNNEILQNEVELTLTDGKGTKDIYFASLESQTSSTIRDVHIVMKSNGEIVFDLTGTAEFIGYPVSSWMSASLKGTCSLYPSRTVSCEWRTGDWLFEIEGMDMSRLDGTYTVYCYSMDIKQISDTFIPDTIARTSQIPSSVTIDAALTQKGQAADAAVVGDRLQSLSEEISDCIIAPATAAIGQTIIVKDMDENGKPTVWETTDFPESTNDLDALEMLAECGIIIPAYQDGVFYTDTDGTIYIL